MVSTTPFAHLLKSCASTVCSILTVVMALLLAPTIHAQQSNGLTFYHLADANTKDASGSPIANFKSGVQTDGKTVAFMSGLYTSTNNNCDPSAELFSVPITGGAVSTIMGPSLKAEPQEPAGTTNLLCGQPELGGSTLFYTATYTPTGGSERSGIFKVPLAGGASAGVLVSGDTVPGAGVVAYVYSGVPLNGINTGQRFSTDPNAYLGAEFTNSSNVGYNYFNGKAVYSSGGSICSAARLNYSGFPMPFSSDGTLFAGLEGAYISSEANPTPTYMRVIAASTGSPIGDCNNIIFAPGWDYLSSPGVYLLPGGPQPNIFNMPPSGLTLEGVAVSKGIVYLSASQYIVAGGPYSGIFTVNTSGTAPVAGTFPPSYIPLTKVIGSFDPVPGITPGMIPPCTGGVSQLPIIGTYAVAGNYLVFGEYQTLQDCTTMVKTFVSGIYAYNLTTKTVQQIASSGATLVAGDSPAYTTGSIALSADGHLALLTNTKDPVTLKFSPVLYSTYLPQTVTAVALTAPSTSTYGSSVTLTAKVLPNTGAASSASGNVQFLDGSTVLGTQPIDSTGSATFSINTLPVGTHTFKALYAGDTLYEGASSATASLAIAHATPTLTLTASPSAAAVGQAVILTAQTAAASGYPTGQIVFSAGSTSLGTGTLNSTGAATLSVSNLPLGATQIVATYGGDANFNGATSSALTVTVGTPDYYIAANPTSLTIKAGQPASFVFTVTPAFGFNQPVAFTCTGLPANATCEVNPTTVTPAGGPVTTTLTIQTNVKTASLDMPARPLLPNSRLPIVLAAGLFGIPLLTRRTRRGRWTGCLFATIACVLLAAASGCSNSGPTTPKGSSTVTMTATAGSGSTAVSHAATVTLTIN